MDEKEKQINEELTSNDVVNQDNGDTLEEKDGVKYETNDNWQFDAEAPTLNNDMFTVEEKVAKNPKKATKVSIPDDDDEDYKPVGKASNNQIVINKEPLKFIPLAIFVAAVIAVLVVLGVRYYTVPNGKEGDKMNPASVVATIDGSNVSVGMYNLYFSSVVSQYETYANYGYYDLDTTSDYSEQYTTDADGNEISWLDYFQEETMTQISYYTAFYNAALKDGVTLTETQQTTIEDQIDSLKESASEQELSLDDYLSSTFGEYCGESTVRLYMEQYYLSVNYMGKCDAEYTPTDDEINSYYEEHKQDYYQINFSYLATEYDASTDEAKEESEELINNYMSQITDRQSIVDLVPTAYAVYIEQDVASEMESDETLTEEDATADVIASYEENVDATISGSDAPFSDEINNWLFDENEPTGTVKYYVNEDTGYAYIILKTEQPTRVEDETYSVRHILVSPEADESDDTDTSDDYTDEQWAAALEKAQSIYDKYNSGDKTEYSFALLAEEYSEDTGSTTAGSSGSFGGLYDGVTLGTMVSDFENWATDDSRSYGDVDIVKSSYGYHIIFFISDMPEYESEIVADIKDAQLDKIYENAEVELHDSVINKANKKFLAEKKAENASSSDTTATTD